MPLLPLLKYVVVDTKYTQEHYRAFYISRIGTSDTADVEANIQGRKSTILSNAVAPNRVLAANRQPPAPINDLPLIIPPDAEYVFTGTAGEYVLLVGKMAVLAPGEPMPPEWTTRFGVQHVRFRKHWSGGTKTTPLGWAADGELSLGTIEPTSVEKFVLDSRVGVQIVAAGSPAVTDGDVSIYFKLDGEPLDLIVPTGVQYGYPLFSFQMPPNDTYSALSVSFKNTPITVEPDHVLEIIARNVSGGSLFGTTAAQFRFWAWCDYTRFL